jgi:tetratricopeptide (TPR) repeat protein
MPGLVRSVRARIAPDPRTVMTHWIEDNVPSGASVATEPGGPRIDTADRTVYRFDLLGRRSLQEYRRDGVEYLVATGREEMLPPSAPDSLRARQASLFAACRELWRSGKYAVYSVPGGDAHLLEAQRAVREERFAEADRLTEQALQVDPENGTLWLLRGQALQGLGDSSAAEAYARAVTLSPADPGPLYALGNLELAARRWDSALAAFEEAGRRAPRDPIALLNQSTALGYAAVELARAGNLDDARQKMADALTRARAAAVLAPGDPEYAAQEGRLRRLGERAGVISP